MGKLTLTPPHKSKNNKYSVKPLGKPQKITEQRQRSRGKQFYVTYETDDGKLIEYWIAFSKLRQSKAGREQLEIFLREARCNSEKQQLEQQLTTGQPGQVGHLGANLSSTHLLPTEEEFTDDKMQVEEHITPQKPQVSVSVPIDSVPNDDGGESIHSTPNISKALENITPAMARRFPPKFEKSKRTHQLSRCRRVVHFTAPPRPPRHSSTLRLPSPHPKRTTRRTYRPWRVVSLRNLKSQKEHINFLVAGGWFVPECCLTGTRGGEARDSRKQSAGRGAGSDGSAD
tara:strand:- start:10255 stop:11112 length:858 start_codon:yes stop_codon:yes gene_type:complete